MQRKRLEAAALLLPLIILYIIPLIGSIFTIFAQGLGYFPVLDMKHMTLGYYAEAIGSMDFLRSLTFSFYTAFISTTAAILLGFIAAVVLLKYEKEGMLHNWIKLPLFTPHFTAAFIIFIMLYQAGQLSRLAGQIGVIEAIDQFPHLIFDRKGLGIILTCIWKETPFAILVIYAAMKSIGKSLKDTAYSLGASELGYVKNIVLPMCMPTIASTFMILFAYNFGAFEVAYLIGPSYPRALPVLAYIAHVSPDLAARPLAMAYNSIIILISCFVLFIYMKTLKAVKLLKA
ncbi:MAG: binding-protein-dependent transport system inner rane component [Clostridia bacterium]|nr:binding-protein-dependent transport system inner rane component [Clostridia bacterium]